MQKEREYVYPEWKGIYEKYTLPEWWKDVPQKDFYKTLAESLNNDFGSYWIDVDWSDLDGEYCLVVTYGDIGKQISRYKILSQTSLDSLLDELIYLYSLHYSDEHLKEIAYGEI